MWTKIKNASIYLFLGMASVGHKFRQQLTEGLLKIRQVLSQESIETKEMLEIYYQYTRGEASEESMARANEQFRDLLKTLGLGVFAILPFAPITIPLVVKLGQKLGINILPSAFKKRD